MGVDGKPKAGSCIHLNKKAAIVCSLKSTDSHSSLVRPVRLLRGGLTWSRAPLQGFFYVQVIR